MTGHRPCFRGNNVILDSLVWRKTFLSIFTVAKIGVMRLYEVRQLEYGFQDIKL